jgi:hypothetical protein
LTAEPLCKVNTRPLSRKESANLACINDAGLASALLFITQVGLRKNILDAVDPLRRLLESEEVHDYAHQGQGEGAKRKLPCTVHTNSGPITTIASLYRPITKKGDPRIWFSKFSSQASADDVCAVFVHRRQLHVLNLTKSDLADRMSAGVNDGLTNFFLFRATRAGSAATELLEALRSLALAGPIPAVCSGPTAVGRSIETALGIRINSSRTPDFRGIEIKSGRSGLASKATRATLFACVPDWSLSKFKSSKEILDAFGYRKGSQFKLYCTITTQAPNSQGLIFDIDQANRWLRESCTTKHIDNFAIWRLSTLEASLASKHRETFWVHASSITSRGKEHFTLTSVTHTRDPNLPQFERLLCDGGVTMDHLIKRTPSGGAREKGPLFKIARPRIQELFLGVPRHYSLS